MAAPGDRPWKADGSTRRAADTAHGTTWDAGVSRSVRLLGRDGGDQIEEFDREAVTTGLHSLSG